MTAPEQNGLTRRAGLLGAVAYGFQMLVQIPFVRALICRRISLGDGVFVEDSSCSEAIFLALLAAAFVCLWRQGTVAVRRLSAVGLAACVLAGVLMMVMKFVKAAAWARPDPGLMGVLVVCGALVTVLQVVACWELSERVSMTFRPLALIGLVLLWVQCVLMSLCTMGTSFGAVLTKMLLGANSIGNGAWAGVFIGIYREGLGPEPGESAWPLRRKLTVATLVLVPIVLLGTVRRSAQAVVLPPEGAAPAESPKSQSQSDAFLKIRGCGSGVDWRG